MNQQSYQTTVRVLPEDVDEQHHVNNMVYLRWVQEIAIAHWRVLASAEAQKTISWVVLRHEIDYKTPAFPNDEIQLTTWVGKATRLTFERFTEIERKSDAQLLAGARTLWCPIDPKSGKPTRVPPDVRAKFST